MPAYETFKWLKSINCSNKESKRLAHKTCKAFGLTPRQYRKTLAWGREKTKVLETLMSSNRFEEIEFDKIPSRAGLLYKKAFARRGEIAEKYKEFAKNEETTVNAGVLYPYEIVRKALVCSSDHDADTDRAMVEKYWNNLPDYFNGESCKMMCVVDTSGSMTWKWDSTITPIDVSIGLGMYCAERIGGPFKNHYISFSSHPQLIEIRGVDFVDKVERIYETNLCENTDLVKTFELIRELAKKSTPEDVPETLVVISDMEIDDATGHSFDRDNTHDWLLTEMEWERERWEKDGLHYPKLVYWNVNARSNNILDLSPDVSFVSGCSPVIFEQILKGVSGQQLMMDKLLSPRYEEVF